jgi:HEAT repeat protein
MTAQRRIFTFFGVSGFALALGVAPPAYTNVAAKDFRISVPDFTAASEKEGDEAAAQVLESSAKVTGELIDQMKDPNSSANAKTLAAYLLGELRTPRAVSTLADNIDLKAPRIDLKTNIGRWGEYPAQEALHKIGVPAAAEILRRLLTEQDDLHRKLMVGVIRGVYGDDLGRLFIQNRLARETDPMHKQNLNLALKEFPQ